MIYLLYFIYSRTRRNIHLHALRACIILWYHRHYSFVGKQRTFVFRVETVVCGAADVLAPCRVCSSRNEESWGDGAICLDTGDHSATAAADRGVGKHRLWEPPVSARSGRNDDASRVGNGRVKSPSRQKMARTIMTALCSRRRVSVADGDDAASNASDEVVVKSVHSVHVSRQLSQRCN